MAPQRPPMAESTPPANSCPPDAHVALRYLRLLYGDDAPGYLPLCTFDDGPVHWFEAKNLGVVAQRAADLAASHNVYHGIGLQPEDLGPKHRGGTETVSALPGLWGDIDFRDAVHDKTNLPPTARYALKLVREFPLSPTLIVHTGHGLQPWWVFRELWAFDTPEERKEAQDIVRRFQATLQAKARIHGWGIDTTSDLARVFRVAGTVNRKAEAVPVSILYCAEDRRYSPQDFEPYLLDEGAVRDASTRGDGTPNAGPILTDDEILSRLRAATNHAKIDALWLADTSGYPSASEADAALCSLLAFYTRDAGQIDRLFRQSGLYRGEKWDEPHYADGRTYGQATVAHALAVQTERYTGGAGSALHSRNGQVTDATPLWRPRILLSEEETARAARGTFIDEYVAHASRRTDAPSSFHEALALVALSAVVGRRAVLNLANGSVYPILWVLILADSTLFRKSTAMDVARELVERVDRDLLAPNDFTPQRFVAILAEHDGRPLLFVRDEFSGFYDGLNRLDYMAGLKETLCNVYDARPFRREKMKPRETEVKPMKDGDWKYDVREPFLSQAVATTEERFTEVARVADVHSGFLVRYGIVLAPTTPVARQPIRAMDSELERERDRLVARLRAVADGDIRLACQQAVFARFDQYTAEIEEEAKSAPDGSLVGIVGSRITWMALRIAMLLAVGDETNRVAVPHLLRGIEIAEGWRHNALKVLGALAPSKFERRATRLVGLVERKGEEGIARREAMRALKASAREMNDLETTLGEREEIRLATKQTPGGPSRWYYPVTPVTPVT